MLTNPCISRKIETIKTGNIRVATTDPAIDTLLLARSLMNSFNISIYLFIDDISRINLFIQLSACKIYFCPSSKAAPSALRTEQE